MILGLDLGGTKLLAARVDDDGALVETRRWPTGRALSPAHFLELLGEVARWAGPVRAAGLGFPGLVDAGRGHARSSVMLDGWRDVPIATQAEAVLGVPIRVDNDVNAAALAELHVRRRAGEQVDDLVLVALGTGIGGAVVLDGRLHRGRAGLAGEIGHVVVEATHGPPCRCGRRGCLGALAPGEVFLGGLENGRAERAVEALGQGLASVLNLLDPGLLVLGGGLVDRIEGLVACVAAATRRSAMAEIGADVRIERAIAGAAAGAWGAALLAVAAPAGGLSR